MLLNISLYAESFEVTPVLSSMLIFFFEDKDSGEGPHCIFYAYHFVLCEFIYVQDSYAYKMS
jgi:hypothetical protein